MSSSPYKDEDPDDVVERTIEGMIACELLTPEQAATKIVSRQLMQVPYSSPVPTLGRDDALAVIQPWLMDHDIDPDSPESRDERFEFGLDCVLDGIGVRFTGSRREP